MRKWIAITVGALLLWGHNSRAELDGISLQSPQFNFDFEWTEAWYDFDGDVYYTNANAGVCDMLPCVVQTTNNFASASLTMAPLSISFESSASPGGIMRGNEVMTGARMTSTYDVQWGFTTTYDQLMFIVTVDQRFNYSTTEQDLQLTLRDVTENLDLWSLGGFGYAPSVSYTNNLPLDPSHQFDLLITGFGDAFNSKYIQQSLSVTVSPVPEPSALTVFILGGTPLWCSCRRRLYR